MKIGIVGHEAAKFTAKGEADARRKITELLSAPNAVLVSGHCHLGGIDIWAEEIADHLGVPKIIYPPKELNWHNGYKPRNIAIALSSDVVYTLVVNKLPDDYKGMRFASCYHCETEDHVKSGGCWTGWKAKSFGKLAYWHIVSNFPIDN